MKCAICHEEIETAEDIHWLDDVIVCSECYAHETQEERA